MELDLIERRDPEVVPEVKRLKTIAATLSLEEQRRHNGPPFPREA